jgi:hypothetical protein
MRLRWNMPKCVRPQELRSTALSAPDFPETRQKLKKTNKNAKFFFWIFSIQKHEINKINAQLK